MVRKFILVLLLLAAAGTTPARAQSPEPAGAAPQESTASDTTARVKFKAVPHTIYYARADNQTMAPVRLSPVEPRESVGMGDVAAMMAWGGGGKTWLTLASSTSELQIHEAQPTFVVATTKLIALQIRLGAMQVRKDKRWVQTEEGRPGDIFRKPVEITVTEVKPNVWKLTPKEPLKPGEYCFATNLAGPLGDFTIVAPEAH
jgi:hypothetical protein